MKKKILKVFIMIIVVAIMPFTLIGCSMTDEQQEALNVITKNTESLVDSFNNYLDGQNKKLDKETTFDMFRQAKLRSSYLLDESSIMNFDMVATDVLTGKKLIEGNQTYDFSSDVKKVLDINNNVAKYDLNTENNSYFARFEDQQIILTRQDASRHVQYLNTDLFSMIGLEAINIGLDDITKVSCEEDIYEFNIIYSVMNKENEDKFVKNTYFCTFKIKDYLFRSVDIQLIRETGDQYDMIKNFDGNLIEDMYGSYSFYGDIEMIMNFKMTYKYGNEVDLTELNSKIADIDSKIESGELSLPNSN